MMDGVGELISTVSEPADWQVSHVQAHICMYAL